MRGCLKKICAKYDVPKSTVCRLLQKFKSTGNVDIIHNGGRPRITTARTDSMITRQVKKDPFISSNAIQKELNISVSSRTIRRRAVEAGLTMFTSSSKKAINFQNESEEKVAICKKTQ